jgi:hypothetical protein
LLRGNPWAHLKALDALASLFRGLAAATALTGAAAPARPPPALPAARTDGHRPRLHR